MSKLGKQLIKSLKEVKEGRTELLYDGKWHCDGLEFDTFEEYLDVLKVGRDGLIIENGYHRGLLLPQVPIEQNWDIKTFLENLCYKAGLYSDAWKEENTKIYSFQAQIFDE